MALDLGRVRDLVTGRNFDVHGLAATVTPTPTVRDQFSTPITTRIIWELPEPADVPASRDFAAVEPRRVMALKRVDVPEVLRGTLVAAPEKQGGTVQTWEIHDVIATERETVHVRVALQTEKSKL